MPASSNDQHQGHPFPPLPPEDPQEDRQEQSFNDYDWNNDDGAILHFSGADEASLLRFGNNISPPATSSTLLPQPNQGPKDLTYTQPNNTTFHDTLLPLQTHSRSPIHSPRIPFRTSPTKHPNTAAAASTSKRGRARKEPDEVAASRVQLSDEELHQKLKDTILADTDLYLRILRYEVSHLRS